MSHRKWWMLLAVVLVIGAGAGVWLWLGAADAPAPPVLLSDGTVIQLRGTTFGTNHTYPGSGFGQRLGRVLPQRWRQRLGVRGPTMTTSRPMLVVWTTARHPPSRAVYPRYVLGGEAGFAPVNSSASISSGSPGGGTIEGWGFSAFPRRSPSITLRIYEPQPNWQDMNLRGEFTMRNPARRKDAPWEPEPLPAARKNDEFAVTLKEMLVGTYTSSLQKPKAAPNEPESGVRAVLRFTRNGEPTKEWAPASVVLTDATGNHASSTSWTGTWQGHDYIAGFKPFLWTDEPAWNLRFEFSRQTNFAAAELWTVRGVPLAVGDLTNNRAFGTNLQGASVQIEKVESRTPYDGDESRRSWSVKFRVKPGREDYRLTLVKAIDEQGREAEKQGSSWGGGEHSFQLGVKTNAASLTLTLALHRSRYEEFRVKPVRFEATATNTSGALRR